VAGVPARPLQLQGVLVWRTSALAPLAQFLVRQTEIPLDPEPLAARQAAGAGRPRRGCRHPTATNRDRRGSAMKNQHNTHERYLHAVRDVVIARAAERSTITAEQAHRLAHSKLLYGVGDGTYRGVTVFDAWENGVGRVDIVEIAATGQESWIQLAGTVIHELGHVLAGMKAGHSTHWKDAAMALGFTGRPAAAGQIYHLAMIDQKVRRAVHELAQRIGDGQPEFRTHAIPTLPTKPRPCSAGIGTKSGRSRGKGSGSRMRLWECACKPKPVKVRVASDDFQATCNICFAAFIRLF